MTTISKFEDFFSDDVEYPLTNLGGEEILPFGV